MTLHDWLIRADANEVNPGLGKWRGRAVAAMAKAVNNLLVGPLGADWPPSRDEVLKVVDAAYPFGARTNFPYKAWLQERSLLIEALMAPEPTEEEFQVLLVADDLVEEERFDEALKLVEEQAPNRHARKCVVCGRPRGQPCREPDLSSYGSLFGMQTKFKDRIVPHRARIQPEGAA
jgi:hypothetical protein